MNPHENRPTPVIVPIELVLVVVALVGLFAVVGYAVPPRPSVPHSIQIAAEMPTAPVAPVVATEPERAPTAEPEPAQEPVPSFADLEIAGRPDRDRPGGQRPQSRPSQGGGCYIGPGGRQVCPPANGSFLFRRR
jgi:hypothetical protein